MSTVIVKGRQIGVDPAAESWLAATDLAGDVEAAYRLSRAVDPARYGFSKREPLDLTMCTGEKAELVLWILEAGQVPTSDAVTKAVTGLSMLNASAEGKAETLAEAKRLTSVIRAERDGFGELVSEVIALHWARHGVGPTWQEAWRSEPLTSWWVLSDGCVPEYSIARGPMFTTLERAGWIAYNRSPHSLCTGRQFHTRFHGDHVSAAPAPVVGYLVANYIGIHRRLHNCSPTWSELAELATDAKGLPLFFNAWDAHAQQRWLETQGWIRIEDTELRRGERAKAETRRRAALRKATAASRAA
ncbi:hypothetical protein [Nocardia salmonicida]|uniref:hypothetical protein n=1 Tax=Nocardia salmonicida TaxID=53431 RepID=UPI000AF54792|nr:hypothetical protein [Nocardia salmonicida]